MKYRITTPYGNWYDIDDNNCIVRCHNGLNKIGASLEQRKTWQILGATSTHPFAGVHIVPLEKLANMTRVSLLYKNGKPRYTIVDLDHGTMRVHGNKGVHGIKSITRI